MAKYRLTGPDGSVHEVTAPDTASQDDVMRYFQSQVSPKTREQKVAEQTEADRKTYDPTNGMSGTDKFVAAYGGVAPKLWEGAKQVYGLFNPSQAFQNEVSGLQGQIDERKRLDAPLLNTGAGMAGDIAGRVVSAIPTAAAGGTMAAAAATGAGLGAIEPTVTGDSRLGNMAVGAATAPVGVAIGRGANALYQGGKALAEPFTEAGRNRIAGRVLNRFADNPSSINTATSKPTVTGALPTLAEQTGDSGIARLQDALRAADPQFNNQIAGRLSQNNEARVNALKGLAGGDGARDFAVAERAGTAGPMYQEAFANQGALTPSQLKAQQQLLGGDRIEKLLQAPAVQEAVKAAQTNALNAGKKMDMSGSIEGLHNVKLAIDDMIKDPTTAAQAAKVAGLKAARDKVVNVIETLSPEYKNARGVYAQMSKPINSMDVAALVAKRGLSNGSDLAGNQTINRNALLGALKDEPSLIRQATGRNAGNALSNVMRPDDLNMLRAIASESDRAGAVAAAGNGPGSGTAQRMASQNVLQQIVGPTGLPKSWAENALANTIIGKPLNLVYGGVAEPKIQQALAKAILDPDQARLVLKAAAQGQIQLPASTLAQLRNTAARVSLPSAAESQR